MVNGCQRYIVAALGMMKMLGVQQKGARHFVNGDRDSEKVECVLTLSATHCTLSLSLYITFVGVGERRTWEKK